MFIALAHTICVTGSTDALAILSVFTKITIPSDNECKELK
jgi:hypothetical protein